VQFYFQKKEKTLLKKTLCSSFLLFSYRVKLTLGPRTSKSDNIGPPTLEKVHFSILDGFLGGLHGTVCDADVSDDVSTHF
jgi:hypothetical protein